MTTMIMMIALNVRSYVPQGFHLLADLGQV